MGPVAGKYLSFAILMLHLHLRLDGISKTKVHFSSHYDHYGSYGSYIAL
jgi:hypothetical protein